MVPGKLTLIILYIILKTGSIIFPLITIFALIAGMPLKTAVPGFINGGLALIFSFLLERYSLTIKKLINKHESTIFSL